MMFDTETQNLMDYQAEVAAEREAFKPYLADEWVEPEHTDEYLDMLDEAWMGTIED